METDMDIELEPNRKGLFQRRILLANAHCHSAYGMLEIVSTDVLELSGDKQPPCAEEEHKLENAEMELVLALANMGAARHIALRGGAAPSSASQLESVDDLAWDLDVRCALEWLEKGEVLATDAHDRMEAARGHLGAAALLRVLNDEGGGDEHARDVAPWEHSPCLSERLNGVMELCEALSKAVDLVLATAAAREAAFCSSGSTE